MIDNFKKELISLEVIKCLVSRFANFPEDVKGNRNAPFHESFLNAFTDKLNGLVLSIPTLISLSSWVHGLNTTLGQAFFEKVTHILSDGEKRGFTTKLGTTLKLKESQQIEISDIITGLKSGVLKPNLNNENSSIFSKILGTDKDAVDFTADNYLEDLNSIIGIEIKTVKPNSGVFQNEKFKILNAKAALKYNNPTKTIKYYLAFPFDPTSTNPTGYDKDRFMKYSVDFIKYFDPEEILLADEFWNFLSNDTNTMKQLLDIINSISTVEFMDNFIFINDIKNINTDKKKFDRILKKWNLFRELNIFSNYEKLNENTKINNKLCKILYQNIFKIDGSLNQNRLSFLLDCLETDKFH